MINPVLQWLLWQLFKSFRELLACFGCGVAENIRRGTFQQNCRETQSRDPGMLQTAVNAAVYQELPAWEPHGNILKRAEFGAHIRYNSPNVKTWAQSILI